MSEAENFDDEEISLIDLFAVLVRYRKFIVLLTALSALFAAAYLFVFPRFSKASNDKKVNISYLVQIRNFPKEIQSTLGDTSFLAEAKSRMLNPRLIAEINSEIAVWESAQGTSRENYNVFIQNLVRQKSIDIPKELQTASNFEIILSAKESKKERASDFMSTITEKINSEMKEIYTPQLISLKTATENSLKNTSENSLSDTQSLKTLNELLDEELKNDLPYIYILGEPFVMSEAQGRAKKAVIVVFAAFFMAVFIAFARNAIENIKADPEASKKISDAWKMGSKSRI